MFKNSVLLSSDQSSGLISSSVLLEIVHGFGCSCPEEIRALLGSMSWADRAHAVEQENDRSRLRFYSDGLDLKAKIAVEKFIRDELSSRYPSLAESVVIYMERKEKPAPSVKPEAPAGAPGHNHSHADHNHAPQTPPSATQKAPSGRRAIPGVKRIIAVASGKGGVGKSTVSVNLALALHNQGYKVGLLDADIYGPSLPMMLGVHEDPKVNQNNKIIPPVGHGVKVMSFGFFASEESAVIWRGPMVMKALQQFFYDVEWGELDFMVIDLPPGTGDAQLTLVQSLPISGAVIVTTPQNVALLDAVKGIVMFQKTDVPIIGIVENMSTFHCPSCGTESHIFGKGGAEKVSGRFELPILGHIPLIPEIREAGDLGAPLTSVPGHPVRVRFSEIAERVVQSLILGKV